MAYTLDEFVKLLAEKQEQRKFESWKKADFKQNNTQEYWNSYGEEIDNYPICVGKIGLRAS